MAVFTTGGPPSIATAVAAFDGANYSLVIGTGSAAEASSNTAGTMALVSSTSALTLSTATTTISSDTIVFTGTATYTGASTPVTITEVGLVRSTYLVARALHTGISVATGDAIAYTIKVKVST